MIVLSVIFFQNGVDKLLLKYISLSFLDCLVLFDHIATSQVK